MLSRAALLMIKVLECMIAMTPMIVDLTFRYTVILPQRVAMYTLASSGHPYW